VRKTSGGYLKVLKERQREARVLFKHQSTGLVLAEILGDKKEENKAVFMKLAKDYDNNSLIELAKDVASRKSVRNKTAYFMAMLKNLKKHSRNKRTTNEHSNIL